MECVWTGQIVMTCSQVHSLLRLGVACKQTVVVQGVSKNCSTFDKILKNKDKVNKLMER